jgi:hypothetical protein
MKIFVNSAPHRKESMMFARYSPPAIAGALLLACLGAAPALALSPVTFVSGKGADSGSCASPAAPCRTFQFALGQTSPGGEIKARDPADYRSVTITKSVSITGVEGAGIFQTANANAITINAGPNDGINLSHLTLDGFKTAVNGVFLNSGGSLTIRHCAVRNFGVAGIVVAPAATTVFDIADVVVSNIGNRGIDIFPQPSGSARGTLDHVLARKNPGTGILVRQSATVLAVNSTAADNGLGFGANSGALLRLAHSAAIGNGTGVFVSALLVESAGDNFINGNGTDLSGTLTKFATQ